ncbi:hypothetical protein [Nonomuraea dietziae]|uniref:Uncharacterized protein n=1 Tax=Nonomuraea dietziae TaxID=65515 RepID=A0A7W5YNN8_9ACTN|nr:hypothetical protein [Nonomuraea dietziae]MBB3724149.1 hypothetical protein [Nonomuraea dietziae]
MRLLRDHDISIVELDEGADNASNGCSPSSVPNATSDTSAEPPLPPTLVRLTQTPHFQRTVRRLAAVREEESHQIQARLVDALAAAARGLKRDDMPEGDWRRLLDSMVLVLADPVE